jgi:hypothetical protein
MHVLDRLLVIADESSNKGLPCCDCSRRLLADFVAKVVDDLGEQ